MANTTILGGLYDGNYERVWNVIDGYLVGSRALQHCTLCEMKTERAVLSHTWDSIDKGENQGNRRGSVRGSVWDKHRVASRVSL